MMLLWWSTLLLCLSANAENIALWPKSVTLKCSSAGCSSSIEGFDGMHLYLYQDQEEPINVFYYHSYPESTDKVTPGVRFTDRIQTSGSLKDQTITISNLTVGDYGSYRCVYIKVPREVTCNVYTLLIRGGAACSVPHQDISNNKSPPLLLIIITTCAVSVVVTVIFILLIILVRRWISSRRRTRSVPQASNDYEYEVMTKYSRRPAPAQSSTPSPHDFA